MLKALSKKHACIEVQRDLHLIYDCESKNRTKKGKVSETNYLSSWVYSLCNNITYFGDVINNQGVH